MGTGSPVAGARVSTAEEAEGRAASATGPAVGAAAGSEGDDAGRIDVDRGIVDRGIVDRGIVDRGIVARGIVARAVAGFAIAGFAIGCFAAVGFAAVGFAVAGFAVAGFAVVGFAVAGFAVVGFAVVDLAVDLAVVDPGCAADMGGEAAVSALPPPVVFGSAAPDLVEPDPTARGPAAALSPARGATGLRFRGDAVGAFGCVSESPPDAGAAPAPAGFSSASESTF